MSKIQFLNVSVDIERNSSHHDATDHTNAHHISDESIKRPSSEFKSGSIAEEGVIVKPAGTTNTATA